jgi:hypothetical protein
MTVIIISVLLAGLFYRKRSERILTIGIVLITVFPIFLLLLNGGLYAEDKALIPFLPLLCYLTALFFQKLEAGDDLLQRRLPMVLIGTIILVLFGIGQTIYWVLALADGLLMLALYFVYLKRPTIKLFIIPVIIILLVADFVIQNPGKLVGRDTFREIFNPDIPAAMQGVRNTDSSYYRMDSLLNMDNNLNRAYSAGQYLTSFYSSSFQKDYFDFRNDVFELEKPYRNVLMQPASQDPLFLSFMGVKYVRSNYAPVGYELFRGHGDVKIYRNDSAFPLGYVTDHLIAEKDLGQFEFPYRQELLLNNAAVGGDAPAVGNSEAAGFKSNIKPAEVIFPMAREKNFSLVTGDETIEVKAKEETEQTIRLPANCIQICSMHFANPLPRHTSCLAVKLAFRILLQIYLPDRF